MNQKLNDSNRKMKEIRKKENNQKIKDVKKAKKNKRE